MNFRLYFRNCIRFLENLKPATHVAVFTVYSVLMNVNDLFTLTHFHYSNMMLFNDSKIDLCIMFPLTLVTIHEYKTGNDVSEFTHSNWITLSYYSSPTHKSLIPKYSIHFFHFCTQSFRAWVGNTNRDL